MSDSSNNRRWSGKGKLFERVGEFVVRKQYRKALNFLDRVINDDMPLFQEQEWEKKHSSWRLN